jgi:hypothetical protein
MPGIGSIYAQQEDRRVSGHVRDMEALIKRVMEELRIAHFENAILRDRVRTLEAIAEGQGQLLDEAEYGG